MDFIKLLDVANPKKIKDTINLLIENYEDFGDTVQAIADKAAEDSAAALLAGNEAKQIAQQNTEDLEEAIASQNTTIQQNKAEQDATIEAAFEVQDAKLNAQDEEIAQNTTTSDQAKQIAEEALAMIEQADARSQAATETAEDALALANESIETSELAMNVATDAKSTVDQAISTGVFGTFVHNTAGISLLHAYMTDDLNQENTDENFYMATPKLVRDALTNYYTKDEAAAKTDIPTEYLVKAHNGYYFGSTKTYSGIKVTNNTNKSYGVYFDPDDFGHAVSGSISGTGYDYRLYSLKDVVRTTDTDQEIAGIKNYTGGLQKNSIDVATVNDIPQAVTVTLTGSQNFNDIVISNEQFELLLSNPENYLIIETSSLTISLKYRRSQYFAITSGDIFQEALIFNCVNSTPFAPYAQRIDSLTIIRQTQNGETNIVVQDDTLDFTTFVPKTRTINGKSLSNDIILTATDVNALPDTTEIPSTLADLTDDSTHRTVTDTEKSTWNAKSDFSGSYNDLTEKPTIPTINVNGTPQSTINFDSDPQTQLNNMVTLDTEQTITAPKNTQLSINWTDNMPRSTSLAKEIIVDNVDAHEITEKTTRHNEWNGSAGNGNVTWTETQGTARYKKEVSLVSSTASNQYFYQTITEGGAFNLRSYYNSSTDSGTRYARFEFNSNNILLGYRNGSNNYNLEIDNNGINFSVPNDGDVTINDSAIAILDELGHSATLLYSIDDTDVAYTLAQPIENFSYILLVNRRAGDTRMPTLIPVGYILAHQNVELKMESWDGSRFRIIFTNTTANVSAAYYATPCEVWGIK